MATKPRYCVNCKHYAKGHIFSCTRNVEVSYELSIIDGRTRKRETVGDRASEERRWRGSHCGPDAKFYVEKRLTQRLIAKFKQ